MVLTTYDILNGAWKATSKILFGEELGELREFDSYFRNAAIGKTATSLFSGLQVWVASEQYSDKAKFFDYSNELDQYNRLISQSIDINNIKDIDSIIQSIGEKFVYAGNKILGNSKNIENSDAVVDSTAVLNSSIVEKSKYVAYGYLVRESENYFASMSSGQSSHIVRCFYNNTLRRCFEVSTSIGSSDCYFSYNLLNCTDCIFTFNSRAKRYTIANTQLTKDSYSKLKTKLIAEVADELKRKKKFDFSIIEIMDRA